MPGYVCSRRKSFAATKIKSVALLHEKVNNSERNICIIKNGITHLVVDLRSGLRKNS
jgi:hypothetical protein